jgi:RNA polymerase sigma factor (TIGR02999 family)
MDGETRQRQNGMSDPAMDFGDDWNTQLSSDARALADRLFPLSAHERPRVGPRERHRAGAGPTLQTTALVNEAYLKLRRGPDWNTDAHFLCAAALAMRHALVNHAQARQAAKRGGGAAELPLSEALDVAFDSDGPILALNEALGLLAKESLRLAQVVECRYFAGFSDVETARALGVSERTVRGDWTLARAWLHRELAGVQND